MQKFFYPVIHVTDREQALVCAKVAKHFDADGVFLINHNKVSDDEFEDIVSAIAWRDPDFAVGVNFLGMDNVSALEKATSSKLKCSMLWADNSGLDNDTDGGDFLLKKKAKIRSIEFFGGVHFKYQPLPAWGIEQSIRNVRGRVDVITLSGPGTGLAADLEFVKTARKAAGPDVKIALASGVTLENVEVYLPYVDAFLVASSIVTPSDYFDIESFTKLCRKIHQYDG